jgi:hypothetical protein
MLSIHSLRTRQHSSPKERKQRRLPRRSPMPPIGSAVVNAPENLRLIVQRGMGGELWKWLMDRGWRVETFRPDRRRYQDIPSLWVTALIDAELVFREQVMTQAVLSARSRSSSERRKPCLTPNAST